MARPRKDTKFPTGIHERVDQCRRGVNPKAVARLASGWVVMGDTQMLPGYCLLLPDPVVASLNDLDETGRGQFLTDMARIGDAVNGLFRPRRINYEMLGNLDPALHAHVFPRYESERAELRTKPVWLYGSEMFDNPAHAFEARKHGAIQRKLAAALAAPAGSSDPDLWQRASAFAARAHRGQIRKDGVTPYFSHPFRVAMTVREVFGERDAVTLAAALLHDTIEDTTCDYDELLDHFGKPVADCVAALTKDMRLIEPARERAYDQQLRASDWRVKLIKLADVYDNLCDLADASAKGLATQHERCRRAIAVAEDAAGHPSVARAIGAVEGLIAGDGRAVRALRSGRAKRASR